MAAVLPRRVLTARAGAAVAALAVASSSRGALADEGPPSLHLAWNAPAGCASEPAVLAEVQRVLAGSPSREATAKADVEDASGHHFRERLSTEVGGIAGEQTLEADSCAELAAATGLILAWTIDPKRAAAHAAAAAENPVVVPLAPSPTPAPPPPPRPPVAPTSSGLRGRGLVAADAVGDVGTLPGAAFAGRFSLGLIVGRVRIEGAFVDMLPGKAYGTGAQQHQGATLQPLEGTLRGCYLWAAGSRVEIGPCLGAGITHVRSDGFGESVPFAQQNAQGTLWVDLTGDATAVLTLVGPLALRASLGFDAPLARPDFVIETAHTSGLVTDKVIHRESSAAGRATLGLEVRFP